MSTDSPEACLARAWRIQPRALRMRVRALWGQMGGGEGKRDEVRRLDGERGWGLRAEAKRRL